MVVAQKHLFFTTARRFWLCSVNVSHQRSISETFSSKRALTERPYKREANSN